MNNIGKNLALWVIIGFLLIALFKLFQSPSTRGPSAALAYSEFHAAVDSGRVMDVTIRKKVLQCPGQGEQYGRGSVSDQSYS